MSWRARVRMMVLGLMLGVMFAAQSLALTAIRQSWCDSPSCGCAASSEGQQLISFSCACDSTGSWRTCTYG